MDTVIETNRGTCLGWNGSDRRLSWDLMVKKDWPAKSQALYFPAERTACSKTLSQRTWYIIDPAEMHEIEADGGSTQSSKACSRCKGKTLKGKPEVTCLDIKSSFWQLYWKWVGEGGKELENHLSFGIYLGQRWWCLWLVDGGREGTKWVWTQHLGKTIRGTSRSGILE